MQGVKNYSIRRSADYRVVESDRLKALPYYDGHLMVRDCSMFDKVLWAFPSCVKAFKHCKPFVSIDDTHLYGKYSCVLLISVAQDGNSNILPEGLLIISDRSQAIKAALRVDDSSWHPRRTFHAYCVRHMAANFISHLKSSKGKRYLINAAYSPSKAGYEWYIDALRGLSREMADCVGRFNKEIWLQHCDDGRQFGHMIANLLECINTMLKVTRYLPISAIVRCTYERLQKLFVTTGREAEAQLAARNRYSQWLMTAIEKNREDIPNMRVTHCDRRVSVFVVEVLEPFESWYQGSFRVRLTVGTYDCGLFQSLHFPCRHALTACAAASGMGHGFVPSPSCAGRLLEDLYPLGFGMTWMRASARRRGVAYAVIVYAIIEDCVLCY
ncbi:uncharacterized protein [Arachis hypogaea]|uniref:uncharacterized protein n=1 Tax=Arachis hypogaea TaxID=3818 RepID=UPI003B22017A